MNKIFKCLLYRAIKEVDINDQNPICFKYDEMMEDIE